MSKPAIYIETTVISYLVAGPSRDVVTASRQTTTQRWWQFLSDYDAFISEAVEQEISSGNPTMAQLRRQAVLGLTILKENRMVTEMVAAIAATKILPPVALGDIAHLTFAACYNVPILVTWNFRHLANKSIIPRLAAKYAKYGVEMPQIFTPEQLLIGRQL